MEEVRDLLEAKIAELEKALETYVKACHRRGAYHYVDHELAVVAEKRARELLATRQPVARAENG